MNYKILLYLSFVVLFLSAVNIYAQFGKNKVQYDNFDWKFIQSSNFDVYFDDGSKYLAEFTAYSAEKALMSIQNTLNYKITKRISIVVYNSHNQFQQTNVISTFMPEGVGGVTELFKNRIVIPFQGDYAILDHVIHHELVHGVLNDMFYGGTFQTAISSNSTFSIPLWMNEGLAEWESIGGMNTETDMFMRDLTISEKLPSLDMLDGYLAYRGGQTFYWYIADKYGKERVGDLINRMRIYRNMDMAFENTFQMNFKDFSEKWQKDIKKFFWPDLEIYEDPDDFAKQITDHLEDRTYYNSSPAISPDGKKMAYISAPGGTFGIFVKNLEEKGEGKKLASSFRQQDFEDLNMISPGISWNPEGTKIAVSAKSGGEDAIFIVDEDDGDYDRLRFGIKSISSVQWSPDGKRLAFIGTQVEKSDIFIYDFTSKQLINLTNDIFSDKNLVWSNDSKSIYFISDRGNFLNTGFTKNNFRMWNYDVYTHDIFKIDISGITIKRLTFDSEYEKTSLAVTPDNDKILFVSDKNGIGNVYSLDVNTLESKPLTNSLTGITQISLSKDGSKLLFTSQVNGGYDIYLMRFPLERKLKIDELPITKLRAKELEERKIVDALKNDIDNKNSEADKLIGYGDFEIDFANQKLVQPSVDANKNSETEQTNEAPKKENPEGSYVSNFQEYDYKVTFSNDVILGNPGYSTYYGFQGVTQMLFSDVMGDHQIFIQANLLLDLRNSQFYVAYNYMPSIIDYRFSVFHTSAFLLGYDNYYYRFRNFGFGTTSSYAFNLFDRLEVGLNAYYLIKENVDVPQAASMNQFLIMPNIKYVHDNTAWGYYGPREGSRYYFDVTGSPKFGDDGAGFVTFSADLRQYFSLGPYFSLAFRGAGAISTGSNPQNFFLGGTDNWINRRFNGGRLPFENPVDFALLSFQTPLRGWAINDARGDKFFLFNGEFRFPLLTALVAGPLPILIQGINGAFFFDMGGAWYNEFNASVDDGFGEQVPANLLMSAGIGIRSYLLGLPVKIDIAWRNEYARWSEPYWLFSLGFDF